jgi:D-alanyl-D-alanine carboxypeptidase (penicillin-binding protein 5/6)
VNLYPDREILPQKTKAQLLKERFMESKELIYVVIGLCIVELIIGASKLYGYIKKKKIKLKAQKARGHRPVKGRK